MPIGPMVSILSNIPWTAVMENAPKIADGATKLWNSISSKLARLPKTAETTGAPYIIKNNSDVALQSLHLRVDSLELSVEELRVELLTATTLISDLAQQNKTLVERVERNRIRIQWQMSGMAMILIVFAVIIFLQS